MAGLVWGGGQWFARAEAAYNSGVLPRSRLVRRGIRSPQEGHGLYHAASAMGIPKFDYREWDGVRERWTAESDLQKYGWRGAAYF